MGEMHFAIVCHFAPVRAWILSNVPLSPTSSLVALVLSFALIVISPVCRFVVIGVYKHICLVLVKIYCTVLMYVHSSLHLQFRFSSATTLAFVFVCVCVYRDMGQKRCTLLLQNICFLSRGARGSAHFLEKMFPCHWCRVLRGYFKTHTHTYTQAHTHAHTRAPATGLSQS